MFCCKHVPVFGGKGKKKDSEDSGTSSVLFTFEVMQVYLRSNSRTWPDVAYFFNYFGWG